MNAYESMSVLPSQLSAKDSYEEKHANLQELVSIKASNSRLACHK